MIPNNLTRENHIKVRRYDLGQGIDGYQTHLRDQLRKINGDLYYGYWSSRLTDNLFFYGWYNISTISKPPLRIIIHPHAIYIGGTTEEPCLIIENSKYNMELLKEYSSL